MRISFIGSGNVAWQLAHAMDSHGHDIHQIISRSEKNARALAQKFGAYFSDDIGMLYDRIDLLIIAVSDDEIANVAEQLANFNIPVAHTSGSVGIDALKPLGSDYGVFYPLQTFSKTKQVDFRNLPFLVEGNSPGMAERLFGLASQMSNVVSELDSERRRKLHLAAVMVNNFSNHLFNLSADYLKKEDIPFSYLVPLIGETVSALQTKSPHEAQTGPAKRNDQETITRHIEMLKDDPELQQLYRLMSASISKKHS